MAVMGIPWWSNGWGTEIPHTTQPKIEYENCNDYFEIINKDITLYKNDEIQPKLHIEEIVRLLSRVQLFVTPWTVARQTSLSRHPRPSLSPRSLLKFMSVMPSNVSSSAGPILLEKYLQPQMLLSSNNKSNKIH